MICNNCIHKAVCKYLNNKSKSVTKRVEMQGCDHFADMSEMIKLPCKIGDMVYEIVLGKIESRTASGFAGGEDVEFIYTVFQHNGREYNRTIDSDNFGKTVFLTESEAIAKLAEMRERE